MCFSLCQNWGICLGSNNKRYQPGSQSPEGILKTLSMTLCNWLDENRCTAPETFHHKCSLQEYLFQYEIDSLQGRRQQGSEQEEKCSQIWLLPLLLLPLPYCHYRNTNTHYSHTPYRTHYHIIIIRKFSGDLWSLLPMRIIIRRALLYYRSGVVVSTQA